MTPTPRLFRGLLLLYIIVGLMVPALSLGYPDGQGASNLGAARLGEMLIQWFPSLEGAAAARVILGGLALYVTGHVVAILGLLDFKRWAPGLALVVFVASGCLRVLSGGHVPSGAGEALAEELGQLILGAILALTYFSPLKHRFARERQAESGEASRLPFTPLQFLSPQ